MAQPQVTGFALAQLFGIVAIVKIIDGFYGRYAKCEQCDCYTVDNELDKCNKCKKLICGDGCAWFSERGTGLWLCASCNWTQEFVDKIKKKCEMDEYEIDKCDK